MIFLNFLQIKFQIGRYLYTNLEILLEDQLKPCSSYVKPITPYYNFQNPEKTEFRVGTTRPITTWKDDWCPSVAFFREVLTEKGLFSMALYAI